MANNRWQIGIAGNYANEDDEAVRNAILDAQQQLGCSTSEAAKHLILRAKSLLRSDVSTHENANAPVDFSIVVETLNQGFSMLAGKLDNINVVRHSATKSAQSVAQDETPIEAEDRLLSTGMSEAALVALKTRVFKPGMRYKGD